MIRNTKVETEYSTIENYLTQCKRKTLPELQSEMNLVILNGLHKASDRLPITLFGILCAEIDRRLE